MTPLKRLLAACAAGGQSYDRRRSAPDMRHSILAAALVASLSAAPALAADPARGEELYRRCVGCHEVGPDAGNRAGPHLNDILGRTAGTLEGARFSAAMIAAGEDGLVWNEATLDAFLEDPRGLIPRTHRAFRGLPDAADRADIIAYLAAQTN